MGTRLKDEIKQNKPFTSVGHEALLNIQRTASFAQHIMQQMLRIHGLTEAQYNVLRILRGAGPEGLRCSEIGERMISRDPDVTRLLERLERQGLIERKRDARDRRVNYSCISGSGLRQLTELDPLVDKAATSMVAHMKDAQLSVLIDLLEEFRQGAAA